MQFTTERVRREVAEILDEQPEDVPLDEELTDAGLDSVRLMTLLTRWNRESPEPIEFADFAERPVIRDWVGMLNTGLS